MHLSPDSVVYWQYGFVKINATIAFTWMLMLFLVFGSTLITRKLSRGLERSRWQNMLEIIVTGIAGPTGGTPDKPVGTVCIGCASERHSWAKRFYFPYGNRGMKKMIFAMKALDLLRRARAELPLPTVAIGGISPENGAALIEAGADMLASVSGVFAARDIRTAASA